MNGKIGFNYFVPNTTKSLNLIIFVCPWKGPKNPDFDRFGSFFCTLTPSFGGIFQVRWLGWCKITLNRKIKEPN